MIGYVSLSALRADSKYLIGGCMTKNELPSIARENLSDLLHAPGGILYSSHETLKPGDIYLLGFNPGGRGGSPLGENIASMLSHTGNAYIDGAWRNGSSEWKSGEAPLQTRVRWLLGELGLDISNVCASNLIFLQSRYASDISFSLAKRCWPVHESILEIVQPKMILAFGNSTVSPYGYLHAMFGGDQDQISSGHGNWKVRGFKCYINGKSTYVAGLPHLSRYSPINKHKVIQWLVSKL